MHFVQEKPYVMVKEGWNLQGNARFEGFCIDLLARVAARAGFHYRLRLVPDNMYGAWDPDTGQWNGIVKELMDRVSSILSIPNFCPRLHPHDFICLVIMSQKGIY